MQADASMLAKQDANTSVDARDWEYTYLTSATFITLTPGTAATLIYTDAQGSPTWLDFPANAVVQTTTITLIPELATGPRPDFVFGQHAFNLLASRDGMLVKDLSFNVPVTVTMYYTDTDVQSMPDESLFKLYWWSGWDWRDAGHTCVPESAYAHDVTNNVINTAICDPGQYGLFATYSTYLPLIFRTAP